MSEANIQHYTLVGGALPVGRVHFLGNVGLSYPLSIEIVMVFGYYFSKPTLRHNADFVSSKNGCF